MKMAKAILLFAFSSLFTMLAAAAADEAQIERGHQVYQKWCFPCHGPGTDKPGTIALEARGVKPGALEERTNMTAPAIKIFVRRGVLYMPTFRKTEISDADLDAMAAFLTRNNKPAARK
jgi:mono/diheme cytochrome c family protein